MDNKISARVSPEILAHIQETGITPTEFARRSIEAYLRLDHIAQQKNLTVDQVLDRISESRESGRLEREDFFDLAVRLDALVKLAEQKNREFPSRPGYLDRIIEDRLDGIAQQVNVTNKDSLAAIDRLKHEFTRSHGEHDNIREQLRRQATQCTELAEAVNKMEKNLTSQVTNTAVTIKTKIWESFLILLLTGILTISYLILIPPKTIQVSANPTAPPPAQSPSAAPVAPTKSEKTVQQKGAHK